MKQILVLVIFFITITSCKQKLPSNVKSALFSYEFSVQTNLPNDSMIVSLTKTKIDSMSKDDMDSLIFLDAYSSDDYKRAEKDLKELLKYNPEYSDYEEIKNKINPYRYRKENRVKYFNNIQYLRDMSHYKFMVGYDKSYEKPKYGF